MLINQTLARFVPCRDATYQGGTFVTKLNAAGNQLVFSTYHGGNNYDYASGIALDNAGNIYISDGTDSTQMFPLQIARQSSNNGSFDAFVSKFNNSGGELLYSTYHGGSGYDTSFDIAVNIETGSAYITGYTQSPTYGTGAIEVVLYFEN